MRGGVRGAAWVGFVTLLVLAPGPAVSPAAWTSASTLSAAGQDASEPAVAMGSDGHAAVVWQRSDGSSNRVQAVVAAPGGAFGTPQTLSYAGNSAFSPNVAVDRAGNAVAVWARSDGQRSRIQVSVRAAGGAFGSPQTLSASGAHAFEPRVAMAPGGTAVVVWYRAEGIYNRIQAAVRPPGGAFGPVQTLSGAGQGAFDPQVAMDANGGAVAVWRRSDGVRFRIETATAPPAGPFGSPQVLSAAGADAFDPQVAVNAGGTAVAVWRRAAGLSRVESSTRPAGGSFGAAQPVSPADAAGLEPRVAVAAIGLTIVVWRRAAGATSRVLAAVRPPNRPFATPQVLSAAGRRAFEPQVAIDPEINSHVAWHGFDAQVSKVESARRRRGSLFAASEQIASPRAVAPRLATGAGAGALAVWAQLVGGEYRVHAARHFVETTAAAAAPGAATASPQARPAEAPATFRIAAPLMSPALRALVLPAVSPVESLASENQAWPGRREAQ
jgi:hypothetical protein